jgi:hypothetical protein
MMRGALLALVAVAAFVSELIIGQRFGRSSPMARDSSGAARVGECEWIVG